VQFNSPTKGEAMSDLIPGHTFEHFIPLRCNQVASDACSQFARGTHKRCSLLIVGPSGLGKTHLQHAIGHIWATKSCIWTNGERFGNELRLALRAGRLEQFRTRYRSCDCFLFDDLQVVAGNVDVERQLLSTLVVLAERNGRVVLCSIEHPNALSSLSPRIKEWVDANSSVVELFAPDLCDRRQFAAEYARRRSWTILPEVLETIVNLPSANFFELQGRLNRFHVGLSQPDIDVTPPGSC
jgi:chromosomal replication initiator protein